MARVSKANDWPEPTKAELLEGLKQAELAFFRTQADYYQAQADAARQQAEARESGLVPPLDILLGLAGGIEATLRTLKEAEEDYRHLAQLYGSAK